MRHRPFQTCVSLTLSLWTGLALPLGVWAETDWYTLKANGHVIGKVGIHSYPAQGNQAGTVTEVSHVNHFTRQGSPFEVNSISRFVEGPEGHKPLSFSYSYDLGEQHLLEAQGSLSDNAIDMRLLRENTETVGQAALGEKQFLFPGGEGIKQVYRQHYQDKPGAQFSYQTLHLGVQPQVVHTEVTSLHREKLALATGESKPVRKFALSNPADRDKKIYEWRDARGKLYKSESVGMGGMEMVYASQREVREIDQNTVDLVNASAVLSNIIPQPRITNEALYKISPLAGRVFDVKATFPESFTQHFINGKAAGVMESASNDVYLKVQRKEPTNSLALFPIDFDSRYLQATPYLQVSDPQLDQTALTIVGKENRAYYAARKLQQWVYKNIAYKDLTLGFASAKETFQRRQGDCTEHAVLLASMLRSLGIPSRVAIGLIYLPDQDSDLGKFVFHMWTEAYIGSREKGDWIPLDATNPEPLPDATHIKLADSLLTDTNDLTRLTEQVTAIMGKIRLDVVKAISPSQSVLSVEKGNGPTAVKIPKIDINRFDVQALSRQAIQHFRIDLPPASLSADSANGLFTSGMEAQSKGNSAQAKIHFGQALSKVRHPVELYQMGERLMAVGQYGLAKQAFIQAKSKDETLAPLVANWMSAGIPETQLPQQQAALFEQAIARHYQTIESGESACELFKSLTQQGVGNFFPAYRGLGESCAGPEAIQAFHTAMAINPDDFQSAESLGDFHIENRRYAEASQAYKAALQVLAGKPFAEAKPWVSDLRGKQEIALGAARLTGNKKSSQGWFHIGKGLALQHRSEDAAQALQNTLTIQPGHTEAFLWRYKTALEQFDWDYLNSQKGRLSGLSGSNAMAARLLGIYETRKRHYNAALASAQRAIALNPGGGEAYNTLFQIYGRMADQALWQKPPLGPKNAKAYWAKAEAALKRGVNLTKNSTEKNMLAMTLGTYLVENNRANEAEVYVSQILLASPLNGRAHWLKGKVLFFAGESEKARAELKTALILLPNDPETLVALGQVAEEEGREAQAMDYYQKAYKADGASYEASQCLRRLMDQLQVSGKRPPAYIKLTPDEHDYLVQVFFLFKQIRLGSISRGAEQLELLKGATRTQSFSVAYLQGMKKNIEIVTADYKRQLNIYNQIKPINTPPKFLMLEYHILQVQRAALSLLNENIPANSIHSEARAKKFEEIRKQESQKVLMAASFLTQELKSVQKSISNTALNGIAFESGWADFGLLSEQEANQRAETQKLLMEREIKAKYEKAGYKVNVIDENNPEDMNDPSKKGLIEASRKLDEQAKSKAKGKENAPVAGKLAAPAQSIYTPPSQ